MLRMLLVCGQLGGWIRIIGRQRLRHVLCLQSISVRKKVPEEVALLYLQIMATAMIVTPQPG